MINRMKLLIDSSFFYALFHTNDVMHERVAAVADDPTYIAVYPEITMPEVAFLAKRGSGTPGLAAFMQAVVARDIKLQPLALDDLARGVQLLATYASANLDFVDCCLMAMAERLNIRHIGTLDRRDFSICRPAHCDYFILLP